MPQKPKSQPKNITTNIFIIVGKTHHNYFVGGSELIKTRVFTIAKPQVRTCSGAFFTTARSVLEGGWG